MTRPTRRPATKHARLVERAAREAGAVGITWEHGGKHTIMVAELPGGVVVRQSIPRGVTSRHVWWENWTKQKIRRALLGQRGHNGR